MWRTRRIRIDRCDGAVQERCKILWSEEYLLETVLSVVAMTRMFVWHWTRIPSSHALHGARRERVRSSLAAHLTLEHQGPNSVLRLAVASGVVPHFRLALPPASHLSIWPHLLPEASLRPFF